MIPVGNGRLRVLIVHEKYAMPGGEDQVVEAEAALLAGKGQHVERWSVHNDAIAGWPIARKACLAWRTTWSRQSYRQMHALAREHRPDIVHFHNTLPLISPSAVHAARDLALGVVMTLHNYRLLCPAATFLRNGRICEDCHTHSLLHGVLHGCYRGSRLQTAAVAAMLAAHRRLGTWTRCVDAYIALTDLMRSKLIQGGLPEQRIHVKPNFVARETAADVKEPGDYAVFLGRLSAEKGVETLLRAAPHMNGTPVRIIGSGPLEQAVQSAAARSEARVVNLGQRPHDEAMEILRRARLLIFPSVCYEGLPITILEAMARGIPIVATRLGAMAEMITHGREGFLFEPGDIGDLSRCVNAIAGDDALRDRMSRDARRTFEERYTEDRGHELLMTVYEAALRSARERGTEMS